MERTNFKQVAPGRSVVPLMQGSKEMARKRLITTIVAGVLLDMTGLSNAQTGAKDPGPPSSIQPSNPPGPKDTLEEGQGTPQYVPGVNRGLDSSIPGEGAGTPPEQHLQKDPRQFRKELPPQK
jgi:hypothetical protein